MKRFVVLCALGLAACSGTGQVTQAEVELLRMCQDGNVDACETADRIQRQRNEVAARNAAQRATQAPLVLNTPRNDPSPFLNQGATFQLPPVPATTSTFPNPTRTNCRPDGLGGVQCVTR